MDRGTIVITEIWTFVDQDDWTGTDLTGFAVEANDGEIGKVDEATYEAGGSYLVVETGPWIFGKKVMLPAGIIERVDAEDERVHVGMSKEDIKNAPEFDESTYRGEEYRSGLADYYVTRVRGFRG